MSSALTNEDPRQSETHSVASNLSREKMQQLLAAIGSRPTEDAAETEATEYSWRQPHPFNNVQLERLEDFTKRVAATVAEKFSRLWHSDVAATVASTTQHFAEELLDQVSGGEQRNYYLALGTGQEHTCGLIIISAETAATWVAQLLGDSESEKDGSKSLSPLEKSLLLDIVSVIVEAICASQSDCDFQCAEAIVEGQFPLELEGTEELCKITFKLDKANAENPDEMGEAHLVILCDQLEPVVGKTEGAVRGFSAEEVSRAILEHLQQMPVCVTAELACAAFSFEQILNLQVNDVLLLDKEVGEPIELIVEGLTVLRGRPAKSAGKYAVAVTGGGEQT